MTTTRTSSTSFQGPPLGSWAWARSQGRGAGNEVGTLFRSLTLNAAADQAFISMSSAFTMLRIRLAFYTCMSRNEMTKEIWHSHSHPNFLYNNNKSANFTSLKRNLFKSQEQVKCTMGAVMALSLLSYLQCASSLTSIYNSRVLAEPKLQLS